MPPRVHPLRRLTWRRPEWPWALLVAGAWIVLILNDALPQASTPLTGSPIYLCTGSSTSMGSRVAAPHGHHHHGLSGASLGWWILMIAAMMLPPALPILREISLQSLWARRYRSAALFVVGYLAVWGVFGAVALGIWSLAGGPSLPVSLAAGAALLIAAVWSLTATKCRCLKRCHRYVGLAPHGRAGDRACLNFGTYNAGQCVGVCWPVMLAMVPGHALLSMVSVAALVSWERTARLPRLRVGAVALAAAGSIMVLGSL